MIDNESRRIGFMDLIDDETIATPVNTAKLHVLFADYRTRNLRERTGNMG